MRAAEAADWEQGAGRMALDWMQMEMEMEMGVCV